MEGVARRLAEITGAEWALVSSGCAAGMAHVTAACVTGGNPDLLVRIPDLTSFAKDEVLITYYGCSSTSVVDACACPQSQLRSVVYSALIRHTIQNA
jgi:hypothetical protein